MGFIGAKQLVGRYGNGHCNSRVTTEVSCAARSVPRCFAISTAHSAMDFVQLEAVRWSRWRVEFRASSQPAWRVRQRSNHLALNLAPGAKAYLASGGPPILPLPRAAIACAAQRHSDFKVGVIG